jgi:hypothetical protein
MRLQWSASTPDEMQEPGVALLGGMSRKLQVSFGVSMYIDELAELGAITLGARQSQSPGGAELVNTKLNE